MKDVFVVLAFLIILAVVALQTEQKKEEKMGGFSDGPHNHFDIVCEECEKRISGCRCMNPNKIKVKKGLCDDCKNKKLKVEQPTIRSNGAPYDEGYD